MSRAADVALTPASAISWPAIFAGAIAAASLSLILIVLGLGLGLSSISPWTFQGASTTAIAAGTIIWLLLTAIAASGLGGYIAGRLRNTWTDSDGDEAHFRDTAHGFLAWAVATLISAAMLTSAASGVLGSAAKVAAAGAGGAAASAAAATVADPTAHSVNYFVDMMFRGAKATENSSGMAATLREARSILTESVAADMPKGDSAYLVQLVASRTGLSPADAEQRVAQVVSAARLSAVAAVAKTKEIADASRKAAAYTALWIFISLLVGAFYSSLAATWGGKQRDPQSYISHAV